tara:strand:+ start:302 stop:802 length:501 start_codon:yes stop_codon:yes gene_type:complete
MNKNSKENQKTELEEHLTRSNYGLVVSQALSFLSKTSNIDDYIQAGLIGLLKAIRLHDSDISKFSTFASVCIRNEILKLKAKENKKRDVKVVFDSNLLAKSASAKYYIKESFFDYVPSYLSEEENFILKLKLENNTNSEICDFLGCTKSVLNKKLEVLFEKIREAN